MSELRKPRPSAAVRRFVAAQRLDDLLISSVTIAEIRFGLESVADSGRRAELNDWLTHRARPMFEQRVLDVSEEVMFKFVRIVDEETGQYVGIERAHPRPRALRGSSDAGSKSSSLRGNPRDGALTMPAMPSLRRSATGSTI